MLEKSTYSVLSPEGFASILWKDSSRAPEAAAVMKMTPQALLEQGVIEGIIEETTDHQATIQNIDVVLEKQLATLAQLTPEELLKRRRARYRKF
ncbi:hypothetical protein LFLT20_03480 [Limosilactobacillus fermentum]|nr:hypothetical protein LFLT20_03480 [Limosilactobacillus fermentum]